MYHTPAFIITLNRPFNSTIAVHSWRNIEQSTEKEPSACFSVTHIQTSGHQVEPLHLLERFEVLFQPARECEHV